MITVYLCYIGPGAGFAFIGSFLILFMALGLTALSILSFPLRVLVRIIFFWKIIMRRSARRVVVVGLDGLDPDHARRLMEKGHLPNLKTLADGGTFSSLGTTCPPISPVAWSSFATGVNPGKHNIFDFLNRDLQSYRPELSSTRVRPLQKKGLFGKRRSEVTRLRKSESFWRILGKAGIGSTVLRVPITYPPEKFRGRLLSAMCVPDLRGSQGTFTLYQSASGGQDKAMTGGERVTVNVKENCVKTTLRGPTVGSKTLDTSLAVDVDKDGKTALLRISGRKVTLTVGQYSDWIAVTFGSGLRKIHGLCRFLLVSARPQFKLYVTPINIDPERPAMPISHPSYFATYLGKLHGPFATLGLAEDTWALSEDVISESDFLKQLHDIHDERERMFFNALRLTREGLCCCVFDATDRAQHMFYRYLDRRHPGRDEGYIEKHETAIDDVYRRMDSMVGEVMKRIGKKTVLFVISDHGFVSFRRGVNINAWLRKEGYLAAKQDASDRPYLANVDWSRTRAYSFGLSGIYINLKGRESGGIVADGVERETLKREISERLKTLADPDGEDQAIHEIHDPKQAYSGPYVNNGPDLIVGYRKGYRASWGTAVGRTDGDIFEDNVKHWSGDHCVDQDLVPGVLFCNRIIETGDRQPRIWDLAPTILKLLGASLPTHMDGQALAVETSTKKVQR